PPLDRPSGRRPAGAAERARDRHPAAAGRAARRGGQPRRDHGRGLGGRHVPQHPHHRQLHRAPEAALRARPERAGALSHGLGSGLPLHPRCRPRCGRRERRPPMSLFLRALSGADTARAPIWLMRQAGRYLPEYRALKERHSFWEMVRTPDLAVAVTLQPLERFALDAAILFQDIMTPLPAMGVELDFAPGPVIARPIRSASAAAALRVPAQDEIAPFAGETIRLLKRATATPVIGFAGAPLTLATYLVE